MISFFKRFAGAPHRSEGTIEMNEFLNNVKYGKWKEYITTVRNEPDKEKRSALKKKLPSVTMSGVFSVRHESDLIAHSGFICIDIDNYSDKTALLDDPYTYALFTSTSGTGLAVVIKINGAKHKESFKWIQNYYYKNYGIVVDPAPSNVASLRFVSYDPELKMNEKSKTALILEYKKERRKNLPVILDNSELAHLLEEIQTKNINITESYEEYRNIAFALADGFGEEGRTYFHIVAGMSAKYQQRHADKQYDIALRGNRQGITVGTFYWMLKHAGATIPHKNKKAIQIAGIAKKNQRTKEGAIQHLVEIEHVEPKVAEKIVEEVYHRSDFDVDEGLGSPKEVTDALIEFLRQNYPMRKNSLTQKIETKGVEITTELMNTIWLQARSFFNSKEVTKELLDAVIFSHITEIYHPITEYIEKNSHRKQNGQLALLGQCIQSETPLKDTFIRKWMIALIAAHEGFPVRSVLALTGCQNSGKSEFFRRLLPDDLKKYYAESKLDAGKDDDLLMCQKLIVMDDEMGGKSKQDEKRFKELTSKSTFSLRAPYGRFNEDFKRLAVLCGTSNDPDIVNDPTGNTRILPVEVLSIDHELYNSIDKDELFMEAYRAYKEGAEWQINKEEMAILKVVSDEFEQTPFERELLIEFFRIPQEGETGQRMSATMIKNEIEFRSQQKVTSLKKLGIELRKMFGKPFKSNGMHVYEVITIRI
jgi:hypothetical protein